MHHRVDTDDPEVPLKRWSIFKVFKSILILNCRISEYLSHSTLSLTCVYYESCFKYSFNNPLTTLQTLRWSCCKCCRCLTEILVPHVKSKSEHGATKWWKEVILLIEKKLNASFFTSVVAMLPLRGYQWHTPVTNTNQNTSELWQLRYCRNSVSAANKVQVIGNYRTN